MTYIMTAPNVPYLVEIAENAARQAGAYLIGKRGSTKIAWQKSTKDELIDADLEAERIILSKLREQAPEIGTFSEEAGCEGNQRGYWIIDPLDGSANFQHGSPLFGIALALVINQQTVASVIYHPTCNEMFTAIQGQGAYLNNTRISTSQTSTLEKAIVHVGDIMKENDPELIQQRLEDISELFLRAGRVRLVGSAAIDLAYVACGRADMLVNHAIDAWDVEAGRLLVLEAGGKVVSRQRGGREMFSIYSNGLLSYM